MANILSQDELDSLLNEMKQLREETPKPKQEPVIPPAEQVQKPVVSKADMNLELALSIPVRVSAELGRAYLSADEILRLTAGSTITLNNRAEGALRLTIKNQTVAHGEVVVKEEKFALRITAINPVKEIISKLS